MNRVTWANVEQVEEIYLPFLIPALGVTDHESLQSQIEGIVKFSYIDRVEVRNDEGDVFAAGADPEPSLEVISHDLVYSNRGQYRKIGSISLFVDRNELFSHIFEWMGSLFLLQLLLAVALSSVMAFVYHMDGRHAFPSASSRAQDGPILKGFSLNTQSSRR
jgi:hypothetical protein